MIWLDERDSLGDRVGAVDACRRCVMVMIRAVVALLTCRTAFVTWLAVGRFAFLRRVLRECSDNRPPYCKRRHE